MVVDELKRAGQNVGAAAADASEKTKQASAEAADTSDIKARQATDQGANVVEQLGAAAQGKAQEVKARTSGGSALGSTGSTTGSATGGTTGSTIGSKSGPTTGSMFGSTSGPTTGSTFGSTSGATTGSTVGSTTSGTTGAATGSGAAPGTEANVQESLKSTLDYITTAVTNATETVKESLFGAEDKAVEGAAAAGQKSGEATHTTRSTVGGATSNAADSLKNLGEQIKPPSSSTRP